MLRMRRDSASIDGSSKLDPKGRFATSIGLAALTVDQRLRLVTPLAL